MDCLKRIKELTEKRGWTMYQLSQAAGIPQSTLSNLFIRSNAPSVSTLEKICDALGITLSEFFDVGKSKHQEEEEFILTKWRTLSRESQRALIEFLNTIK